MPEGFTNEQLREAASEAGISPVELRQALAEREGALVPRAAGALATLQGGVALAVPEAVTTVRKSLERLSGRGGHAQGDGRYDIVDDDHGLTYRISAQDDGAGHSLVRIDVDTDAGRGALMLAAAGTGGVALTVTAIGWLFSLTLVWLVGLGLGGLGAAFVAKNLVALSRAKHRAEALAATALGEAQGADPGGAR